MKQSTAELIVLSAVLAMLVLTVVSGFMVDLVTGIFTWFAAGGATLFAVILYAGHRPSIKDISPKDHDHSK